MYIRVNASDVARFTGHNRYCAPEERRTHFWSSNRRLARKLGIVFQEKYGSKTEEFVASIPVRERQTLCAANGLDDDASVAALSQLVHERVVAPAVCEASSADADKTMAATLAATMSGMSDALTARACEAVGRDTQIRRGIEREDASLDRFEKESGVQVIERNAEFLQATIGAWNGHSILLVGKVDGRLASTGEVVEAKERRNRLFGFVPDYERVQLHCYMHLTATRAALLRERHDSTSAEHRVVFDDAFWTECLERLDEFLSQEIRPPP